eukprot:CAMPEP_0206424202 /NCGR_PEP_ID=MMETSP0324_2-20121206/3100_1 /ASSEMBLY_ACC=CAM_ASM_000836 /TAXON_ID=2866 /ORGANISM="Crypthecodinium cohnii, Strain Seligo" /LENGTH=87 /DNA_ID=CAMNT_0053888837 /DNA_START=278 /DNA_END=541 /DNA_ORIENTATION=-
MILLGFPFHEVDLLVEDTVVHALARGNVRRTPFGHIDGIPDVLVSEVASSAMTQALLLQGLFGPEAVPRVPRPRLHFGGSGGGEKCW